MICRWFGQSIRGVGFTARPCHDEVDVDVDVDVGVVVEAMNGKYKMYS